MLLISNLDNNWSVESQSFVGDFVHRGFTDYHQHNCGNILFIYLCRAVLKALCAYGFSYFIGHCAHCVPAGTSWETGPQPKCLIIVMWCLLEIWVCRDAKLNDYFFIPVTITIPTQLVTPITSNTQSPGAWENLTGISSHYRDTTKALCALLSGVWEPFCLLTSITMRKTRLTSTACFALLFISFELFIRNHKEADEGGESEGRGD